MSLRDLGGTPKVRKFLNNFSLSAGNPLLLQHCSHWLYPPLLLLIISIILLCHVQQQQHKQEHIQQEMHKNVVVDAGGLDHDVCIRLVGRPTALALNVYY